MKRLLIALFLFIVVNCFSPEKFQPAPLTLKYKSVFSSDSGVFVIVLNQPLTKTGKRNQDGPFIDKIKMY